MTKQIKQQKKEKEKPLKLRKELHQNQDLVQSRFEQQQLSPQLKPQFIRIIPLGGQGEVGRNMVLIEYKREILVIDMGLGFPDEAMPGIDCLIPNSNYLKVHKKNIRGIILTHGHYDHIGAVPYIIPRIGTIPIYTGALSRGIILKRQEEFPNHHSLKIETVVDGSQIKLGLFEIEFVRLNHNIPDNFGLFIKTPLGNIFHTSDFKFDSSPVNELPTDFQRLKNIGKRNILLLMSESTSSEEEGHSLSEKIIFQNLEKIFQKAEGRIIAASFSSLINRIQQLITLSENYSRKVIIEGRSMKNNIEISQNLKQIKIKKGTIISIKEIDKFPDKRLTVLCTGAQGEEDAAFMRIANKEHKYIQIKKEDSIIFSSSVIPGNERTVQALKDEFYRQGARVYHYKMMDIHASGHARQEELKEMIQIMKPKFFLPIYGQYSMLVKHAELAIEMGIPSENILIMENGQVINLTKNKISFFKEKIPANLVMVDGLGIGDVGEIVLRDRQVLACDGMFVIIAAVDRQTGKVRGSPDIISRGFVYLNLKESKTLLKETRQKIIFIINQAAGSTGVANWIYIKNEVRNKIGEFLFHRTRRRPLVLPVIIEV